MQTYLMHERRFTLLEVELVVAIGKTAPETGFVTPEEAEEYVFGYAAGVEFTRRNFQKAARENRQPWEKAKCFDDSALITEIREKHRMPDMDQATLWLYVDNQERQRGNTNQMMHSIPELVSEISKYWRFDGRRPDLHRNSERKRPD